MTNMKIFYSILNNLMVGIAFTVSTIMCSYKAWIGLICFIISYMLLDVHSYIDKKLGYPNNAFINNKEENENK